MTLDFDKFQITKQLQGARQELAKSLGLRDEVFIEPAADEMDEVQAAAARELAIRRLEGLARTLHQIDEALRKLTTGDYGVCESCEEPIRPKRLLAVPWAQLCLSCQEIADQSECGDSGEYETEPLMSAP